MSESIWEELARSPLDPDPGDEQAVLPWIWSIAIAAVAGLLLGLFFLGSSTGATSTTTVAATPPTTETTSPPPPPDPEVPGGYVDIDGVGLDAKIAYSRAGNLYVVVSEAARSDREPPDTPTFHASEWVLSGDGVSITASRAIESTLTPGVVVVEFPGVSALPDSAPSLTARRASEMVVRTGCHGCGATSVDEETGEITLAGIARPYAIAEPLAIDVGAGIALSVDHLEFTNDWGYAEWHVVDANDAILRTSLRIVFEGTDDPARDDIQPTQLIPQNLFGASQQNPTVANPEPFARSGSLLLERAGELISADNSPTSLVLRWTVEWQHPVGEPIAIPLANITDLGIID